MRLITPGRETALEPEDTINTDALKATDDYSASKATHPRVSLLDMEGKIADRFFFTAGAAVLEGDPSTREASSLDLLTICLLQMRNGLTIIGKSAPASPENFDPDKGQTFAYEDAIRQLWPLEGYALRERLSG